MSTRDISIELATNGLASLYTGTGAEYDENFDTLQRVVLDAQKGKRGIWSKGIERMMDPAEYKRAIRNGKTIENGYWEPIPLGKLDLKSQGEGKTSLPGSYPLWSFSYFWVVE